VPEIFSLLRTLMEKETGLQYLETVIRYLASVLDEEDLSLQQIKEMAEQAISKETGGYIMTLAEKLRKEGEERGEKRGLVEGEKKGLVEGEKKGLVEGEKKGLVEGEKKGLVEGEKRGEKKGKLEGFREAIELGITLKFPGDIDAVMAKVNKIDDVETLVKITKAIKIAKNSSEIFFIN